MKRMPKWLPLVGAYAVYGALALLPAVVAVALDWQVYTATPGRCLSLSFAGAIAVALLSLQASGHAPRKVKRVVWYALAAGVLWGLSPIIDSLALLVTCMAAGEGVALLVAMPLVRRAKRHLQSNEIVEVVADAITRAKGRV